MPPATTKSKICYVLYKGHGQGHKVIDLGVIWNGFKLSMHAKYDISISNGSKVMAKVKGFFATEWQTDRQDINSMPANSIPGA